MYNPLDDLPSQFHVRTPGSPAPTHYSIVTANSTPSPRHHQQFVTVYGRILILAGVILSNSAGAPPLWPLLLPLLFSLVAAAVSDNGTVPARSTAGIVALPARSTFQLQSRDPCSEGDTHAAYKA